MQITRSLVLMLAASLAVTAQSERGNITGIVTDPTGAAIGAAELSVIHRDTNATAKLVTTSSGEYNAPNLQPGSYRIEITAPGFKRFIRQNINVSASTTVRVDAKLQLGQVSEQIEVSAAVATIQTDDAKVSTQVENKLVDELPLQVAGAMRSPFNLVAVVPEAQGANQAMSLGGGQVAAWDATLDGYSVGTNRSGDTQEAALNTPSLESLTEFTVDTNGFKAEYGQAGGGIMSFASKSGTNKFHGSTYDFLRNDALDARGFFARTKGVYRQNDFGFTAAGPVWFFRGRGLLFVKLQELVSVAGDSRRSDVNTLLITPIFIHAVKERWWVLADSETRTNWLREGRTGVKSGLQIGRTVATGFGVWAKPEVWWGPNRDGRWNLKLGLVWYR